METGIVNIGQLTLESGIVLDQVHLAYEWTKKENAPTVLVCHALTGSEKQRGAWRGLIGRGKSVNTEKYAVITFTLYSINIPEMTIRDQVQAERKALLALGIHHLRTIIGASQGGLRVFEWGMRYPNEMDLLIPIAASPAVNDTNVKTAQNIKAKTVLLGFTYDAIYSPDAIREFAHLLPNASFCLVNTRYGHDGFLTEFDTWGLLIRQFMEVAGCRQLEPQYLASAR